MDTVTHQISPLYPENIRAEGRLSRKAAANATFILLTSLYGVKWLSKLKIRENLGSEIFISFWCQNMTCSKFDEKSFGIGEAQFWLFSKSCIFPIVKHSENESIFEHETSISSLQRYEPQRPKQTTPRDSMKDKLSDDVRFAQVGDTRFHHVS